MTLASDASRRFDKDAEELLQLRQDVFRSAQEAATRRKHDWPKNTLLHHTNPRLAPVCSIGNEHLYLGDDGTLKVTVTDPSIHFPQETELVGLSAQQLADIKQALDWM